MIHFTCKQLSRPDKAPDGPTELVCHFVDCKQPIRNEGECYMSEYIPRLLHMWDGVINCKVVKDHGHSLCKYVSKLTGYVCKPSETQVDIGNYIIGDMKFKCNDCGRFFVTFFALPRQGGHEVRKNM